LKACL